MKYLIITRVESKESNETFRVITKRKYQNGIPIKFSLSEKVFCFEGNNIREVLDSKDNLMSFVTDHIKNLDEGIKILIHWGGPDAENKTQTLIEEVADMDLKLDIGYYSSLFKDDNLFKDDYHKLLDSTQEEEVTAAIDSIINKQKYAAVYEIIEDQILDSKSTNELEIENPKLIRFIEEHKVKNTCFELDQSSGKVVIKDSKRFLKLIVSSIIDKNVYVYPPIIK